MSGKMKSSSDADLVHSMSSLLKEDLLDADEHKMDSILLRCVDKMVACLTAIYVHYMVKRGILISI